MKINILKKLLIVGAFLGIGLGARAFEGQWKLHPTFDESVERVLDTPNRVFMLALAQPYVAGVAESPTRQGFLYVYDKKEDEMTVYDSQGVLTQSVISRIDYNSARGYLLIVYEDGNIDLLFDNDRVINIPAIKSANIPSSKTVNGVSFDASRNHAYLATDFGFVILDDKKGEVYESRIYNRPFRAAARLGDRIVVADEDGDLYSAPATAPNFAFSDFSPLELGEEGPGPVNMIFRINGNMVGLLSATPEGSDNPVLFSILSYPGPENPGNTDEFLFEPKWEGDFSWLNESASGHILFGNVNYLMINSSGGVSGYALPGDIRKQIIGSYNGMEFWEGRSRKGLRGVKKGTEMTVFKDYMMPDASSVYISQDMAFHPSYGLLVSNRGNINYFGTSNYIRPILISGLKDNRWIRHGLPYTNSSRWMMMLNPSGLAIDPKNTDHVYFGSLTSGIGRINLKDPSDVFHMSTSEDVAAHYPEFVAMLPVSEAWTRSARMAPPKFDREGNLWSLYNNLDSSQPTEVWVWPRANIDATKDPATFKPWVKIPVRSEYHTWNSRVLPLTSSGNTTRVFVSVGMYQKGLIMIDHKGTLANTGDDTHVTADALYDQDGQPTGYNYIRTLYEDPSTGLVWVGTDTGVFTVNPSTYMSNPSLVSRVKVARDDGTSLADYLLNGVDISTIISDPYGRKWFGTVGGGLVCTSSDGRVVKGEWTTDNSPLPDNNVYGLGWNDASGSLMVSTGKGLAEFFPAGEGDGSDFESLRVFPNPVRPDYFGWVTIDGLTDGALVKITDAHGNTVRELGRVSGGTVQWDAANLNGRRVPSGVYYILASGGESDSNLSKVGKVLVVN